MAGRHDLQLNMGSEQWGEGFYSWCYGSVILVERRVLSCEHTHTHTHKAKEEPNTEAPK